VGIEAHAVFDDASSEGQFQAFPTMAAEAILHVNGLAARWAIDGEDYRGGVVGGGGLWYILRVRHGG
jgi:hypothetical protein